MAGAGNRVGSLEMVANRLSTAANLLALRPLREFGFLSLALAGALLDADEEVDGVGRCGCVLVTGCCGGCSCLAGWSKAAWCGQKLDGPGTGLASIRLLFVTIGTAEIVMGDA